LPKDDLTTHGVCAELHTSLEEQGAKTVPGAANTRSS